MRVAAGLLLDGTGIRTVASRVGYRSEAAFTIAFKRWAGVSPSGYRRRMLRAETENLRARRSAIRSLQIAFAHPGRTHTLFLTVLMGRNQAFLTSAYNLSLQKKEGATLCFKSRL